MTFQKLTYNSDKYENYLYFSFDAEYFDTDIISQSLNVQPTSVSVKKDPIPKSTSWKYKISAGKDIDLETYLERLLIIFESKTEIINKLKEDLNLETHLQFVINIEIDPDSSTPYFGLNKRTIDFLGRTRTQVDFDLYKADSLRLLDKITEGRKD